MAKDNWKALRGLGPAGNGLANLITFATTNWVLVVSAVLGVGATVWNATRDFFLLPQVWVAIGVFLAILWTAIGLAYLRDRKRPREIYSHQDYRYGLTFDGIIAAYDPSSEDSALLFALQVHNYSMGPMLYEVMTFDVLIEDRTLPRLKKGELKGYMPRGGAKVSGRVPFKKETISAFSGRTVKAVIDITIVYGHPERPPERQLVLKIDATLTFTEQTQLAIPGLPAMPTALPSLRFAHNIIEERDEPYVSR
jgi:hypothetical protein